MIKPNKIKKSHDTEMQKLDELKKSRSGKVVVIGGSLTEKTLNRNFGSGYNKIFEIRKWSSLQWNESDLWIEQDGNRLKGDWFLIMLKKAGAGAYLIRESFSDFLKAIEGESGRKSLLFKVCPENMRNINEVQEKQRIYRHTRNLPFTDNGSDNEYRSFKRFIEDTISRGRKDLNLDSFSVITSGDVEFIEGLGYEVDITQKKPATYALKQNLLKSISGNIDIDLINFANNLLKEKNKAGKNKNGATDSAVTDLSFISLGTNWPERDKKTLQPDDKHARNEQESIQKEVTQKKFLEEIIRAIINRTVLNIKYKPHGMSGFTCEVSPHRLRKDKQWIIYGHSENKTAGGKSGLFSFKIGRITDISVSTEGSYVDEIAYKITYQRMSHHQLTYDVISPKSPIGKVILAVRGKKISDDGVSRHASSFKKMKEQPLHESQREITLEEMDEGARTEAGCLPCIDDWGFFEYELYDANRIFPLLLPYGSAIKVLAPAGLRSIIKKSIEKSAILYGLIPAHPN